MLPRRDFLLRLARAGAVSAAAVPLVGGTAVGAVRPTYRLTDFGAVVTVRREGGGLSAAPRAWHRLAGLPTSTSTSINY